ncbi:MAG: hypothetical protein JNL21_09675 [Myxococcales bacterium]|nr:hypothetical protein [Myxococcales bacterium]
MSIFSIAADLPAGIVAGRLRDDIGASRGSAALHSGGVPSIGQRIVVEVQIDPSVLSFEERAKATSWVLITGEITRAEADLIVVDQATVTSDVVPRELEGAFKLLLEKEEDAYRLRRLIPIR